MAVERPLVRKFAEMLADAVTCKYDARPALDESGVYPRSVPSSVLDRFLQLADVLRSRVRRITGLTGDGLTTTTARRPS